MEAKASVGVLLSWARFQDEWIAPDTQQLQCTISFSFALPLPPSLCVCLRILHSMAKFLVCNARISEDRAAKTGETTQFTP